MKIFLKFVKILLKTKNYLNKIIIIKMTMNF